MKLILASASERRRELLSWFGIPFEVHESGFNEDTVHENDPAELVMRLALEKAKKVSETLSRDEPDLKKERFLVLGADTVIYIEGEPIPPRDYKGGEIIGKPVTPENSMRILQKLSGRTHEVYTGVAVLQIKEKLEKKLVGVDVSKVTFKKLTNKEIKDYVDTREPLDKGGGYAIQMGAKRFVTNVSGSYTNVVGLPLLLIRDLLTRYGVRIAVDVKAIIKEKTGYLS